MGARKMYIDRIIPVKMFLAFALATLTLAATGRAQNPDYLVWVASEATDRIALVRFSPDAGTARV
ncbi:MAG: hypothetical protein ACREME_02085, partial [Gemmatimonadales bacterium]